MKFRLIIVCTLFLAFSTAIFARETKIQVVVTTDVHGRLFSYDFINDKPLNSSLASVHYMMQSARSRSSNNIILLDNGDLLQGSTVAYYANFKQQHRQNMFARVMNMMKYDAITVGNHDIEAGPQVYNRLIKEFNFPYLGANVINTSTGKPHFVPYTIIRRQNIRVAVLGLTTTGVPNWLPEHLWEGLEFQSMLEAAQYWVPYIMENEKPDLIVGLFHSGMGPAEVRPGESEPESASQYIARNVEGFDIIFTGHDHRERVETVAGPTGKDVLIMGPAPYAESIAVAEVTFEQLSRREFRKKSINGELVSAKDVVPSREYLRAFEKDIAEIIEYSGARVGTLNNDLSSIDAFYGSAPFSDLIHKVQMDLTGADISFTAPLAFNEVVKAGTLRVRDFFKLYQYENYLYAMQLSGKEIRDYLEYSYSLWLNDMQGPDDHLLLFRYDQQGNIVTGRQGGGQLRNPFYNFDSAAGIVYTVDASQPAGSRVDIISMENGDAFDDEKTYRVAINSYRGSGGGGHLTTGAGIEREDISSRIVFTTSQDLRSELINYFMEHQQVEVKSRNNWQILPAQWIEQARRKDMEVMFPE